MKSEFLYTLADVSQFPTAFQGVFLRGRRESRIAMVGRSNVGKSTLVNRLLGTRLAQTSKQPGKTRAIHFYYWGDVQKIVADLPGFGYAKAAQQERSRWEGFIQRYLEEDVGLERILMLLDSRHGPTELDCKAMEFLSLKNIPLTVIFTKADLLKTQSERSRRHREADQALKKLGVNLESVFWVSSSSKAGLSELVQSLKKSET